MEQVQQLVIGKQDARKLYPTASAEWKVTFEATFGKDFFSQKPQDRVKTVEDACEVLGLDPDCLWDESEEADILAYKKLKVIVRAFNYLDNNNEEWLPDYDNSNEYKWKPWFYMNKPGFRLDAVGCGRAGSYAGSRLDYKSESIAKYGATQFLDLYRSYFEM